MKLKLNFNKCCVYIINMPEQKGDCVATHRGVTLDHLSNLKKKRFFKNTKNIRFQFLKKNERSFCILFLITF